MTIRDEMKRMEQADVVVYLYDLDYGHLVGSPGNPTYVAHFTSSVGLGPDPIVLDAITYEKLPIRMHGLRVESQQAPPRPRVQIANADGRASTLIDSIGGSLTGAYIVRRSIYSRHLDDGSDPDPRQIRTYERWVVERKTGHNRYTLEFELSAAHDIEGHKAPARVVESTLCPFTYLEALTCGWDRTGGPWFDAKGNSVGLEDDDVCGLTFADCKLRFGDSTRKLPLRYGGYPAVGSAFR